MTSRRGTWDEFLRKARPPDLSLLGSAPDRKPVNAKGDRTPLSHSRLCSSALLHNCDASNHAQESATSQRPHANRKSAARNDVRTQCEFREKSCEKFRKNNEMVEKKRNYWKQSSSFQTARSSTSNSMESSNSKLRKRRLQYEAAFDIEKVMEYVNAVLSCTVALLQHNKSTDRRVRRHL